MPFPVIIRLIYISALLLPARLSFSQSSPAFTALRTDPSKEKDILKAISIRYENDISSLSGKYKKYSADIYKERYDLITKMFSEKEVITDPVVNIYLQSLAEKIFKSNPSFNAQDVRLLFSRSPIPNANSMGEGTIFFNIGLFNRLQNEGQAAFVICHELAHYFLNHGNNSIQLYVNTIYSDEFQKQLKTIQKTEYQQNKQLVTLAKSLTFRSRRHNRYSEESADSMAVELMKNTGFDLREALHCLAILDSVDKDKYESILLLDQRFDFAEYPFKKKWLEKESVLYKPTEVSKNEEEKDKDSLKTHPDCQVRIKKLEERVNEFNKPGNKSFLVNEKSFNTLKDQFDYEVLNYCLESGNVSRAIYYSLEMLHYYPDNSYLYGIIGKGLNVLYAKQKIHELGKVASLPDPDYDESYNELLQLIQNLRLPEIASLSYYFHLHNANKNSGNEEFLAALIQSKDNFGRPEEKQEWINLYRKEFPNGNYKF